jgi:hypothetical protein
MANLSFVWPYEYLYEPVSIPVITAYLLPLIPSRGDMLKPTLISHSELPSHKWKTALLP